MRRLERMTRTRRPTLALMVMVWTFWTPCGAHAVDIVVKETLGIARKAHPAGLDVPFPRGGLKDPKALGLTSPKGAPVPFQAHVSGRWGDDSVQWLRVDFLADVDAEGTVTYKLAEARNPGPPVPPQERLQVAETPDRYRITGGDMEVHVGKEPRLMLAAVQLGQTPIARPETATLSVTKGPARAEVEAAESIPQLPVAGELRVAATCTAELKYLLKAQSGLGGILPPRTESIRVRARTERLGGTRWVRQRFTFSRSLQDVWVRVGQRFDLGEGPLRYDLCAYNKFSGALEKDESVTLIRDEEPLRLPFQPTPRWAVTSGPDYDPSKVLLRGYVPKGQLDRKMQTAGWAIVTGKQRSLILSFQEYWRRDFKKVTIYGDGRVEVGVYLRPMINLPVVSSEQDRWATATFTYAFYPTPLSQAETAVQSLAGGVAVACPAGYYLSCGLKPPAD